MMNSKKILLSSLENAKEFVKRANQCDFDIDVCYNRIVIDAKSILGVLSLDLRNPVTVQYNGCDEEFEAYLQELNQNANFAA